MNREAGSVPGRRNRFTLWLVIAAIAVCALWLPFVASDNLRLDSERMLFHADEAMAQYVAEGRFGLVALTRIFGLDSWQPLKSGILYAVFFVVSGMILTLFLRRDGNLPELPALLFFLLYGTCPFWETHAYFTLQAPVIAFCLPFLAFIGCADARLIGGRKFSVPLRAAYEVIALAVITFCLTVYQALGTYAAACAAMLLFTRALRGEKPDIRSLLVWFGRMILALILYAVLVRKISGGLDGYLTGQIGWTNASFLTCVKEIVVEFGKNFCCFESAHFSLYPVSLVLLAILILRRKKAGNRAWLLLTGIAVALLPMAMSFAQGARIVPRAQFAIQITAALTPVLFVREIGETGEKKKDLRVCCALLAAAAILLQPLLVLRALHTDNVRNEKDLVVASAALEQIAGMDYENKNIVFVGTVRQEFPFPLTERANVIGQSFFDWSWEEGKSTSATTGAVRLLRALDPLIPDRPLTDAKLKKQEAALAKERPAWPEEGFVTETEDFILVNLPDR
ncbi:MAG: glucosyltransferase domain-containing protein [Clostridia bacterium]|nr:glucosyltransferase domain-containing protein [Clostridia bacterium]